MTVGKRDEWCSITFMEECDAKETLDQQVTITPLSNDLVQMILKDSNIAKNKIPNAQHTLDSIRRGRIAKTKLTAKQNIQRNRKRGQKPGRIGKRKERGPRRHRKQTKRERVYERKDKIETILSGSSTDASDLSTADALNLLTHVSDIKRPFVSKFNDTDGPNEVPNNSSLVYKLSPPSALSVGTLSDKVIQVNQGTNTKIDPSNFVLRAKALSKMSELKHKFPGQHIRKENNNHAPTVHVKKTVNVANQYKENDKTQSPTVKSLMLPDPMPSNLNKQEQTTYSPTRTLNTPTKKLYDTTAKTAESSKTISEPSQKESHLVTVDFKVKEPEPSFSKNIEEPNNVTKSSLSGTVDDTIDETVSIPSKSSAAKRLQELKEIENRIVEPNINVFVPLAPILSPPQPPSSSTLPKSDDMATKDATPSDNQPPSDDTNLDDLQDMDGDTESMDDVRDSDLEHSNEDEDSAHIDNGASDTEQMDPTTTMKHVKVEPTAGMQPSKSGKKMGNLAARNQTLLIKQSNSTMNSIEKNQTVLLKQSEVSPSNGKVESSRSKKLDNWFIDSYTLVNDTATSPLSKNTTKTFYSLSEHLDANSVSPKQTHASHDQEHLMNRFGDMGEAFRGQRNNTSNERIKSPGNHTANSTQSRLPSSPSSSFKEEKTNNKSIESKLPPTKLFEKNDSSSQTNFSSAAGSKLSDPKYKADVGAFNKIISNLTAIDTNITSRNLERNSGESNDTKSSGLDEGNNTFSDNKAISAETVLKKQYSHLVSNYSKSYMMENAFDSLQERLLSSTINNQYNNSHVPTVSSFGDIGETVASRVQNILATDQDLKGPGGEEADEKTQPYSENEKFKVHLENNEMNKEYGNTDYEDTPQQSSSENEYIKDDYHEREELDGNSKQNFVKNANVKNDSTKAEHLLSDVTSEQNLANETKLNYNSQKDTNLYHSSQEVANLETILPGKENSDYADKSSPLKNNGKDNSEIKQASQEKMDVENDLAKDIKISHKSPENLNLNQALENNATTLKQDLSQDMDVKDDLLEDESSQQDSSITENIELDPTDDIKTKQDSPDATNLNQNSTNYLNLNEKSPEDAKPNDNLPKQGNAKAHSTSHTKIKEDSLHEANLEQEPSKYVHLNQDSEKESSLKQDSTTNSYSNVDPTSNGKMKENSFVDNNQQQNLVEITNLNHELPKNSEIKHDSQKNIDLPNKERKKKEDSLNDENLTQNSQKDNYLDHDAKDGSVTQDVSSNIVHLNREVAQESMEKESAKHEPSDEINLTEVIKNLSESKNVKFDPSSENGKKNVSGGTNITSTFSNETFLNKTLDVQAPQIITLTKESVSNSSSGNTIQDSSTNTTAMTINQISNTTSVNSLKETPSNTTSLEVKDANEPLVEILRNETRAQTLEKEFDSLSEQLLQSTINRPKEKNNSQSLISEFWSPGANNSSDEIVSNSSVENKVNEAKKIFDRLSTPSVNNSIYDNASNATVSEFGDIGESVLVNSDHDSHGTQKQLHASNHTSPKVVLDLVIKKGNNDFNHRKSRKSVDAFVHSASLSESSSSAPKRKGHSLSIRIITGEREPLMKKLQNPDEKNMYSMRKTSKALSKQRAYSELHDLQAQMIRAKYTPAAADESLVDIVETNNDYYPKQISHNKSFELLHPELKKKKNSRTHSFPHLHSHRKSSKRKKYQIKTGADEKLLKEEENIAAGNSKLKQDLLKYEKNENERHPNKESSNENHANQRKERKNFQHHSPRKDDPGTEDLVSTQGLKVESNSDTKAEPNEKEHSSEHASDQMKEHGQKLTQSPIDGSKNNEKNINDSGKESRKDGNEEKNSNDERQYERQKMKDKQNNTLNEKEHTEEKKELDFDESKDGVHSEEKKIVTNPKFNDKVDLYEKEKKEYNQTKNKNGKKYTEASQESDLININEDQREVNKTETQQNNIENSKYNEEDKVDDDLNKTIKRKVSDEKKQESGQNNSQNLKQIRGDEKFGKGDTKNGTQYENDMHTIGKVEGNAIKGDRQDENENKNNGGAKERKIKLTDKMEINTQFEIKELLKECEAEDQMKASNKSHTDSYNGTEKGKDHAQQVEKESEMKIMNYTTQEVKNKLTSNLLAEVESEKLKDSEAKSNKTDMPSDDRAKSEEKESNATKTQSTSNERHSDKSPKEVKQMQVDNLETSDDGGNELSGGNQKSNPVQKTKENNASDGDHHDDDHHDDDHHDEIEEGHNSVSKAEKTEKGKSKDISKDKSSQKGSDHPPNRTRKTEEEKITPLKEVEEQKNLNKNTKQLLKEAIENLTKQQIMLEMKLNATEELEKNSTENSRAPSSSGSGYLSTSSNSSEVKETTSLSPSAKHKSEPSEQGETEKGKAKVTTDQAVKENERSNSQKEKETVSSTKELEKLDRDAAWANISDVSLSNTTNTSSPRVAHPHKSNTNVSDFIITENSFSNKSHGANQHQNTKESNGNDNVDLPSFSNKSHEADQHQNTKESNGNDNADLPSFSNKSHEADPHQNTKENNANDNVDLPSFSNKSHEADQHQNTKENNATDNVDVPSFSNKSHEADQHQNTKENNANDNVDVPSFSNKSHEADQHQNTKENNANDNVDVPSFSNKSHEADQHQNTKENNSNDNVDVTSFSNKSHEADQHQNTNENNANDNVDLLSSSATPSTDKSKDGTLNERLGRISMENKNSKHHSPKPEPVNTGLNAEEADGMAPGPVSFHLHRTPNNKTHHPKLLASGSIISKSIPTRRQNGIGMSRSKSKQAFSSPLFMYKLKASKPPAFYIKPRDKKPFVNSRRVQNYFKNLEQESKLFKLRLAQTQAYNKHHLLRSQHRQIEHRDSMSPREALKLPYDLND